MTVNKETNYWCPNCKCTLVSHENHYTRPPTNSSGDFSTSSNTNSVGTPPKAETRNTGVINSTSNTTLTTGEYAEQKKLANASDDTSTSSTLSNVLLYGGMAVGTVCTVPIIAGFGTGGVVAGSLAAAWQSSIGNVAAGSLFAALQSAGATSVFSTGAAYGGMATATGIVSKKIGTWRKDKGGGASETPIGGGDQEEEHHYKNHSNSSTSPSTPAGDDARGEEQEPDDYDGADKEKDGITTDISEKDSICENISSSKNAIMCPLCHTVSMVLM